ncbi:hypothetical protein BD779DRAFT_1482437, partial [Infundibulicybe gibba]
YWGMAMATRHGPPGTATARRGWGMVITAAVREDNDPAVWEAECLYPGQSLSAQYRCPHQASMRAVGQRLPDLKWLRRPRTHIALQLRRIMTFVQVVNAPPIVTSTDCRISSLSKNAIASQTVACPPQSGANYRDNNRSRLGNHDAQEDDDIAAQEAQARTITLLPWVLTSWPVAANTTPPCPLGVDAMEWRR